MEASVTKALYWRGREAPSCRSSRRSTPMINSKRRGCSQCRSDATDDDVIWSTHASRVVTGSRDKLRSRSAEASRLSSGSSSRRCRSGCAGGCSESMETLDVSLLSPDSGAIVFGETPPDNEPASTTTTATPDCLSSNEVGDYRYPIFNKKPNCRCGSRPYLFAGARKPMNVNAISYLDLLRYLANVNFRLPPPK